MPPIALLKVLEFWALLEMKETLVSFALNGSFNETYFLNQGNLELRLVLQLAITPTTRGTFPGWANTFPRRNPAFLIKRVIKETIRS